MTVVNTNIAETINIDTNGTYDVARYTTANVSVGGSKYALLDRVKDDSNNEIGTVVGFHKDANNTEYAVVCLDAQFRLGGTQYLSSNVAITGLPQYSTLSVYGAKETATFNCDKILAQATTSELTSPAVSHCRSKTFTIDGVQYAGQLPTLMELLKIIEFMNEVNSADTSVSQYSWYALSVINRYCSSSQYADAYGWCTNTTGGTQQQLKNNANGHIAPILEIPIQ